MTYNLSKKLMKNLISKISSYALQKIRKQWKLMKKFKLNSNHEAYEKLNFCSKIFVTTMKLSCFHMIKTCMKTSNFKLSLDDVHFHWWIKKSTIFNETTTNSLIIDNVFYWMRRAIEIEFSNDLSELNELLANSNNRMKSRSISSFFENEVENINNQNIDMKSRSFFSVFEPENLIDLLKINELAKIKTKKKT